MGLVEIHRKLAEVSKENPTIAFDGQRWGSFMENAVRETLFSQVLQEVPTPLSGVLCELNIDTSQLTIELTGTAAIVISKLILRATLRAEKVTQGYLTNIEVKFDKITASIVAPDGKISLEMDDGPIYDAPPPDVNSPERDQHIKELKEKHGWSEQRLEYFVNRQEPFLSGLIVEAYYPDLLKDVVVLDLSVLLPSIKFFGRISVSEVTSSAGDRLVCFLPEFYEKVDVSPCVIDSIGQMIKSGGSQVNDQEGRVPFGTVNGSIRQKYLDEGAPKNTALVYAYIPEKAIEPLFGATKIIEEEKRKLVSTGDNWRVGPFTVKHSYSLTVGGSFGFLLRNEGPVVDIEKTHESRGHLEICVKVGKMKHKLCEANVRGSHDIKYSGSLYADLPSGNLGFTGEFYDPTNIDYKFEIETPLPDKIDKVFDRFVNDWCKPVVRLFLTYLLASVTWGFMSRFVFPSRGESAALALAGYITPDQKSMTIAVDINDG
ncbi:hypothetical protein [Rhizobium leguminosarum]|uniref:hypothetical protein n=1 Tax=Rhizobium leguminosarum TaxID=384 RepID=UPI0010304864|nr:hypothetical protein [Rhizobium leguminosarum]TBF89190.1 hypothetical protein ELG82_37225 [Rhizobium leguminosarum]